MVLLDPPREKNRKDTARKPLTKGQKRRRLAVRIVLVFAVLVGLSLGVLASLADHPALKEGARSFLSAATGMNVSVESVERIAIFPVLEMKVTGVRFEKEGEKPPVATMKSFHFSMNFWDRFLSRTRLNTLEAEDLHIRAGVLTAHAIDAAFAGLRPEGGPDGKTGLVWNGRYGPDGALEGFFSAHHTKTPEGRDFYDLDTKNGTFRIKIGLLEATGKTDKKPGALGVTIDKLTTPAGTATGSLSISSIKGGQALDGTFSFGESKGKTNLTVSEDAWRGTLRFAVLDLADIAGMTGIYDTLAALSPAANSDPDAPFSFGTTDISLTIRADRLQGNGADLGKLVMPVSIADNKFQATIKEDSRFSGGKVAGALSLNAQEQPARLDGRLTLTGWEYGQLMKAYQGHDNVKGTADLKLKLGANGKTAATLVQALDGEAVLIAGSGEMQSTALNIWGRGVVNAMLPSLDPKAATTLNCVIADFKIADGVATADPFFLDTGRVTVRGEGTVDLPAGQIDMVLTPKGKEIAILDISPAVSIAGPVFTPKIKPTTSSLLKKLGGAALGLVNPAFLAFSLTDLGLTESHPCHAFIAPPPTETPETP
ncbi:MAG: AsmA family protein [Alphaproteobacteria bacterium]|nr:AsmA family protein [Alphaproteobacteria bacterium]